MSKNFGRMVGCEEALEWVMNLLVSAGEEDNREFVLNRMRYEFAKDNPIEPKYHKGIYGSKFDSYTCGNCGFQIRVVDRYCPNCGFRITDNFLGRRKSRKEQNAGRLWRNDSVTEKQQQYIQSMREFSKTPIPEFEGKTKGEAEDYINKWFSIARDGMDVTR